MVNNAGISPKRVDQNAPWLSQTSLDEWGRVVDVNLNGPFILMRLLAPAMIANGYGRIINVGSLAGRAMPMIAGPHYAASKAGLVGLTRAAARDLAPHGITVNCIAPGRILSDLTGPPETEVNRSALSRIPVGRFGTAEEVAHVVTFLASPMAGFITGATIDMNRRRVRRVSRCISHFDRRHQNAGFAQADRVFNCLAAQAAYSRAGT
ncbi:3-oxoacyl-[acyl-carrier protein] reductase [Bradyrhizobium sp. GM6.1]